MAWQAKGLFFSSRRAPGTLARMDPHVRITSGVTCTPGAGPLSGCTAAQMPIVG